MPGPLKVVLQPDRPGRKEPALWELQAPVLRATDQGFVPATAPSPALLFQTLPTSPIPRCRRRRRDERRTLGSQETPGLGFPRKRGGAPVPPPTQALPCLRREKERPLGIPRSPHGACTPAHLRAEKTDSERESHLLEITALTHSQALWGTPLRAPGEGHRRGRERDKDGPLPPDEKDGGTRSGPDHTMPSPLPDPSRTDPRENGFEVPHVPPTPTRPHLLFTPTSS